MELINKLSSNIGFILIAVICLIFLAVPIYLCSVGGALYFLNGIGFERIACKLDLPKPWMEFIPVARLFAMAKAVRKVSERFCEKTKNVLPMFLIGAVMHMSGMFWAIFAFSLYCSKWEDGNFYAGILLGLAVFSWFIKSVLWALSVRPLLLASRPERAIGNFLLCVFVPVARQIIVFFASKNICRANTVDFAVGAEETEAEVQ